MLGKFPIAPRFHARALERQLAYRYALCPREPQNASARIVKDEAEAHPLSSAALAHTPAYGRAEEAARAAHRPDGVREDHRVARAQRHDVGQALLARPLLDQH